MISDREANSCSNYFTRTSPDGAMRQICTTGVPEWSAARLENRRSISRVRLSSQMGSTLGLFQETPTPVRVISVDVAWENLAKAPLTPYKVTSKPWLVQPVDTLPRIILQESSHQLPPCCRSSTSWSASSMGCAALPGRRGRLARRGHERLQRRPSRRGPGSSVDRAQCDLGMEAGRPEREVGQTKTVDRARRSSAWTITAYRRPR